MDNPLVSETLPTFNKKMICQKHTEHMKQLNISKVYKCYKTCSNMFNLTCIGSSRSTDALCGICRSSKLKASLKI